MQTARIKLTGTNYKQLEEICDRILDVAQKQEQNTQEKYHYQQKTSCTNKKRNVVEEQKHTNTGK